MWRIYGLTDHIIPTCHMWLNSAWTELSNEPLWVNFGWVLSKLRFYTWNPFFWEMKAYFPLIFLLDRKIRMTRLLFGWPYHPPPSLMVPFSLTPASSLWSHEDALIKSFETSPHKHSKSVVISKFPLFSKFSMKEYLPLLKSGFFGRGWKNPVFQRLESWNQEKNWI